MIFNNKKISLIFQFPLKTTKILFFRIFLKTPSILPHFCLLLPKLSLNCIAIIQIVLSQPGCNLVGKRGMDFDLMGQHCGRQGVEPLVQDQFYVQVLFLSQQVSFALFVLDQVEQRYKRELGGIGREKCRKKFRKQKLYFRLKENRKKN